MEIVRVRLVDGESGCENAPADILRELRNVKSDLNGNEIEVDKLRF